MSDKEKLELHNVLVDRLYRESSLPDSIDVGARYCNWLEARRIEYQDDEGQPTPACYDDALIAEFARDPVPRTYEHWRTRALRAEALLGCAGEVASLVMTIRATFYHDRKTPPDEIPGLQETLRLLATDHAELMRLVPETAPIIKHALDEARVGLEEG